MEMGRTCLQQTPRGCQQMSLPVVAAAGPHMRSNKPAHGLPAHHEDCACWVALTHLTRKGLTVIHLHTRHWSVSNGRAGHVQAASSTWSHQVAVVPHQAACIVFLGLAVPVAMRLLGMHGDSTLHQLPKHCRHGSDALQRLGAQQMLPSKCWLLRN